MQLTVLLIRRAVSGEREAQDELLRMPGSVSISLDANGEPLE